MEEGSISYNKSTGTTKIYYNGNWQDITVTGSSYYDGTSSTISYSVYDEDAAVYLKKQEYETLYGEQPPSTIQKPIKSRHGVVRIMSFERFGYEIKFKPSVKTVKKKRNCRANRAAYELQDRQQNKYRLMSHNRR